MDWRRCFRIGDLARLIGLLKLKGPYNQDMQQVRLPLPPKRPPDDLRCLDALDRPVQESLTLLEMYDQLAYK